MFLVISPKNVNLPKTFSRLIKSRMLIIIEIVTSVTFYTHVFTKSVFNINESANVASRVDNRKPQILNLIRIRMESTLVLPVEIILLC